MTHSEVRPGTVVVGVDGSPHAETALRWAADEADLEGRALTVVHVVKPLTGYEISALANAWTPPNEIRDAIWKHAGEELDAIAERLHQSMPNLEVELVLREGDARQVLLDLSKDAASLFVGSRGRGPVASLLLGSVGVALSRAAWCPVYVIRPYATNGHREGILVGTDCTERTRPTLELAYRQAALRDLPLTVLHTAGSIETIVGLGEVLDDDVDGFDSERRLLAETVSGLAEKFPEVRTRLRLGHGSPDACLVEESKRMDLVVVGHHQGRAAGDLFRLGSFVAPVVESAECPVLIAIDRSATAS